MKGLEPARLLQCVRPLSQTYVSPSSWHCGRNAPFCSLAAISVLLGCPYPQSELGRPSSARSPTISGPALVLPRCGQPLTVSVRRQSCRWPKRLARLVFQRMSLLRRSRSIYSSSPWLRGSRLAVRPRVWVWDVFAYVLQASAGSSRSWPHLVAESGPCTSAIHQALLTRRIH
jgi:hypothetical protein